MLSPADQAVVARDPALPALTLLLDDEALGDLLGAPVARRYLRYKPGTSCVAAVALPGGQEALVAAYGPCGHAKADKTLAGAPDEAVLAHDPVRRLLAVRPSADRDLPALAALADPRRRYRLLRRLLPAARVREGVALTTLAWKPHRRWVGVVDLDGAPVVLRAYPVEEAGVAAAVLQRLEAAGAGTPRLLGHVPGGGLVAVQHLPGEDLARALRAGRAGCADLQAAGRALAALHATAVDGLRLRSAEDEGAAVRAAAAHVAVLLPDLARDAHHLAEALAERMSALPAVARTLHGDFSTDQVVVDGPHVRLMDLDRAAVGHPATDFASAVAAAVATLPPQSAQEAVLALECGYEQHAPLPDAEAAAAHTAAALLRRAAEPFRTCRPDWPGGVAALLEAAQDASGVAPTRPARPARPAGPLDRSPADLVAPLLRGPVRLDVLKDKPGRRRTSRATSSGGTAIVKVYASERAPVVARRVAALAAGPPEPAVPQVLLCDEARHVVVLSEVPGRPFTTALLEGDVAAAARVGRALAAWHRYFRGRPPTALRPHTAEHEGRLLLERAAAAPGAIAAAVREAAPALLAPWACDTVVHRDLYEEQVVLADVVGLLDLDDAAVGPAELDLGNLAAHLHLLGRRSGVDSDGLLAALLGAYEDAAPLDRILLARCRRLSLLRLACLHHDPDLLPLAG